MLDLWDRWKKFRAGKKALENPPPESIATRFVEIFESHGVHRNQIPRFIGHQLTIKDVQDDASLLARLDEPLMNEVCSRFAVRREWLDGAESQVHPLHDFYLKPEQFRDFIDRLVKENPDQGVSGYLLVPEESGERDALIVLQEPIGAIGENTIYRYHLVDNWAFTYWKSRAYLVACVAIAWKLKAYLNGRRAPATEIAKLANGETLLGWDGNELWALRYKLWHAEDMALEPDVFLDGIDPEVDAYGIKSALKLWLELDNEGWMDTGFPIEGVRNKFIAALGKAEG